MGSSSTSTIGNAKPTGGIYWAPLGTAVPVDADAAPGAGFLKLGYVSEGGLTPGGERSTNSIKDWSGDIIAQLQSEHSSRFDFELYAVFDPDVLGVVFGPDNVTVTGPGKVTVTETGDPLPHGVWLWDMAADGGKKLRILTEDGQPSNVTEGPMVAADLMKFGLTVEAFKNVDGVKTFRYYDSSAASGAPTISAHAPASIAAAGGELVTLTGSGFAGATAVTFGGTAASDFEVVSNSKIVAIAPAKSAGSVNVIVTTPAGASTPHAVTYA
ncbi:IPT/TIG domain-containing protein [Rhodococcus sp. NPDC058532]|uniref:IPT/TIG domain-containing protein n=1 Tax=Rhodococcus sp. NPDC058532 TaxID=3346540 RepID=UPI00366919BF